MMGNGKRLEKITALISETLKDHSNTQILTNYKIPNSSGNLREIDVLIQSEINSFEIKIAIECKDYKKAVPVKEIEAFNSKCERINGINKKVFVSSSGNQKDSINAASSFNIELYDLNKINSNDILEWFPIKQLKINFSLKIPCKITVPEDFITFVNNESENEIIINFYEEKEPISISSFLWDTVVINKQDEYKCDLLYDFLKNGNMDFQTIFPFKVNFTGIYILGINEIKIPIYSIESYVIGWLCEENIKNIETRKYNKLNSPPTANTISLELDNNESADFVITENNKIDIFHTNSNGNVSKLKPLFNYDPLNDKFNILTDATK